MRTRLPILRRLREPGLSGREGRLGEVIRSMKAPPQLTGDAQARILRKIRFAASPRAERLWIVRPTAIAVVALVSVVFLGIAANAGISRTITAGISWIRARVAHERIEPVAVKTSDAPQWTEPKADPAVANAASNDAPIPVDPPVADSRPARRRARATALPGEESPLGKESRLLARALDQVRTARDYAGALATLAEYDARFPAGVLKREAALARLDALTALGQSDAALELLDSMDTSGPRASEVLVLRGELRSNAGRQREALADFARALATRLARSLRERAIYGRASCRARLGDVAAARSDLEDYLAAFPDGAHAAEVRRRLGR
jgi:hypothetical protein